MSTIQAPLIRLFEKQPFDLDQLAHVIPYLRDAERV
jgi:hypothetical protein